MDFVLARVYTAGLRDDVVVLRKKRLDAGKPASPDRFARTGQLSFQRRTAGTDSALYQEIIPPWGSGETRSPPAGSDGVRWVDRRAKPFEVVAVVLEVVVVFDLSSEASNLSEASTSGQFSRTETQDSYSYGKSYPRSRESNSESRHPYRTTRGSYRRTNRRRLIFVPLPFKSAAKDTKSRPAGFESGEANMSRTALVSVPRCIRFDSEISEPVHYQRL